MRLTLIIVALAIASTAGAAERLPKHNGADGGNGLSNGMPGCGGGTDPSPDGKFYVRGTNRECNPGKQDRAKLKQ
ncbi:hypothetical protein [Lichenibacterium dinghuense]|uniref:hypothetical protein n=1 Tax=Lichenibacterium dinghuense TaxID=2895977 RepID=UPI001F2AAA3D|nr:hypothetical protein [Lichenibacterium sp. 6Y81]